MSVPTVGDNKNVGPYSCVPIAAKELLFKSVRIDLIYKFLYAKKYLSRSNIEVIKAIYLESIRVFNRFKERDQHGKVVKKSPEDFTVAFENLLESFLLHGYIEKGNMVNVCNDSYVVDAAHRVASGACLDVVLWCCSHPPTERYDYKFFMGRGLPTWVLDFGAFEFARLSPYARLLLVNPCVSDKKLVDDLIGQRFPIYYKKSIKLTFEGFVNLKKLCYLEDSWIGTVRDGYSGAFTHATRSWGESSLDVFLIVSESPDSLYEYKSFLRNKLGKDNYSVHSTDAVEDTMRLSEYLFNSNSVSLINNLPITFNFRSPPKTFKDYRLGLEKLQGGDEMTCIVGSFPLLILGKKIPADLDYISGVDRVRTRNALINKVELEVSNDLLSELRVIEDPRFHLWFFGAKIWSFPVLIMYKFSRNEVPKDELDILSVIETQGAFSFSSNAMPPVLFDFYDFFRRVRPLLGFLNRRFKISILLRHLRRF